MSHLWIYGIPEVGRIQKNHLAIINANFKNHYSRNNGHSANIGKPLSKINAEICWKENSWINTRKFRE